jgi:hypothetical protein
MDTQVNKSFNNMASWFAPKNKVYCGSCSLTNRLSIALGINSVGLVKYFWRLYKQLGINLTKNVLHCLQMKERTRSNRLNKIKTKEKKKERMKRGSMTIWCETRPLQGKKEQSGRESARVASTCKRTTLMVMKRDNRNLLLERLTGMQLLAPSAARKDM